MKWQLGVRSFIGSAVTLCLLLIAPVLVFAADKPEYRVVDLGAGFYPRDINNNNEILGTNYPWDSPQGPISQVLLWREGVTTVILQGEVTFPPGKEGNWSSLWQGEVFAPGFAINDSGQVVATKVTQTAVTVAIPTGYPGEWMYELRPDYRAHACLWHNGNIVDLHPHDARITFLVYPGSPELGLLPPSEYSQANDINDRGDVVGWVRMPGVPGSVPSVPGGPLNWISYDECVIWPGPSAGAGSFKILEHPTLFAGGPFIVPMVDDSSINNERKAVGTGCVYPPPLPPEAPARVGSWVAFQASESSFSVLEPLGGRPECFARMSAINDAGLVVGTSFGWGAGAGGIATLWEKGVPRRILDAAKVTWSSAADINEATQVIGTYHYMREYEGWQPVEVYSEFLWDDGETWDLNELFDEFYSRTYGAERTFHARLARVEAINDKGAIVGWGSGEDGAHGYLLLPGGPVFEVDNDGDVYADGEYKSPAADFAEMWPIGKPSDGGKSQKLQPGDLLALAPDGGVMLAGLPEAGGVVGVYAAQAGLVGGGPTPAGENADDGARVPVAIAGIVRVKVSNENGAIRPGDPLSVSKKRPGHVALARPSVLQEVEFHVIGSITAKALEGFEGETGIIKVLLFAP